MYFKGHNDMVAPGAPCCTARLSHSPCTADSSDPLSHTSPPPTPSPWQPPFRFLLYKSASLDPSPKWIPAAFALCDWLISLSGAVGCAFTQMVANGSISFCLRLNSIALCMCIPLSISVHLLIDVWVISSGELLKPTHICGPAEATVTTGVCVVFL